MKIVAGMSTAATVLIAGMAGASDRVTQLITAAKYSAAVSDDKLFLENGRALRADLYFSVPGKRAIVAPEGTELDQNLPPVVWQYSGLLPVDDYLKTVAIHTFSSSSQDRSWQEVQQNFYHGLLAEGAKEIDAKIAYAGAYAFAPRWTLVELIEVEEAQPKYPDTVLYRVQYTEPSDASISEEKYRDLSLQILQQEILALHDIQTVIDESEMTQANARDRVPQAGVGELASNSQVPVTVKDGLAVQTSQGIEEASNTAELNSVATDAGVGVDITGEAELAGIAVAGGALKQNNGTIVGGVAGVPVSLPDVLDKAAPEQGVAEKKRVATAEPNSLESTSDVVTHSRDIFPGETIPVQKVKLQNAESAAVPASVPDNRLKADRNAGAPMPRNELFYDDSTGANASIEAAAVVGERVTAEVVEAPQPTNGLPDQWVAMPDGSLVLQSVGKLVSE